MITSTLSHLPEYRIISTHFAKAIDYILAADFASMAPGKYDIDGLNSFAIVNEYMTKTPADCDPGKPPPICRYTGHGRRRRKIRLYTFNRPGTFDPISGG